MTGEPQSDETSLHDLQQEADRLEAVRQCREAVHCLIDSRTSLQHRLREAAYPVSVIPVAALPLDLQKEHAAIWRSIVGPGDEPSHVLARIDATLAGMRLAEMAELLARIVALHGQLQALDGRYRTIEDL